MYKRHQGGEVAYEWTGAVQEKAPAGAVSTFFTARRWACDTPSNVAAVAMSAGSRDAAKLAKGRAFFMPPQSRHDAADSRRSFPTVRRVDFHDGCVDFHDGAAL
jgi:hypothetical protein